MSDDERILVIGATGGQGGAVVEALLARRALVRAAVRRTDSEAARRLESRGVEVVPGSLEDADSLALAMRGTTSVFALTTPFEAGVEAEIEQGRAILAGAERARVPHLVFSSVAGADQDSGVPHFESKAVVEGQLAQSDVPHTILGPTYFFDNALGGVDDIRSGRLNLPLPANHRLQQLAREDLGVFAAEVLIHPASFVGQRIELASDAPTPAQMATALTVATGNTVDHVEVPLAEIQDPDMKAMWEFLLGPGYQVDIPSLHAGTSGMRWTTFGEWAETTFS